MIPKGWQLRQLEEVVEFQQGIQVPIEDQFSDPASDRVQFLRITDYTKSNEAPRYIQIQKRLNIVNDDDVVMVRYGEAGRVVYGKKGAIANNLFSIRAREGILSNAFMVHLFNGTKVQKSIQLRTSSSAMPQVSHKSLYELEILIPPLNEQQKISEILNTWNRGIELLGGQVRYGIDPNKVNNSLLEQFKLQRSGLENLLLSGKLRVQT